nr:zinc finger, CCHC-type [Tanacetum cinerariifolium]
MAAAATKHMALNFAKLYKFRGVDFGRWQKKMHFLLFSMSVVYVLTTPIPEDGGDNPTVEQVRKRAKWDNDDYVCRGLILNVLEQYNELLGIRGRFTQHKMNMDETIQVSCIIDKLPPSWKDFKHTLKHKKEELNLVELGSHLRIKESLRDDDVVWWVDSGATMHACKDRCWFKTYESLNDRSIIYIGNESTTMVHGCSFVDLRLNIVNDNNGSAFMSTSKLNDSILWHARLGYVHFKRMKDMSKDGLIPAFDMDTKKCERGIECIFVGYTEHSKAFRFYVIEPNKLVSINSIIESRNAIFDENRFSSVPRPSLMIPNGIEDISGLVVPEEVTEEKEAINDEMDSIIGNNTWVLADLPPGCKPLGIDYFDTYALVARISTIRLMIAMASIHNLIIHQMDVKTTFLNGELEEKVYMNQPQGFIMPGNENKDMGYADVIMVIRIKHESNGIAISQSHYIEKVLKKFNYFDCTPVRTLMDKSEKLMPNNGQDVSQLEYSRVIRCLMYYMTCTSPNIVFAMGKISRPIYTSNPLVLEGYTDASWINNTKDNSSTSSWVFLLSGDAISLASMKQTCITGSTRKYEFVALAATGKEAEWLKNLLLEIPLWVKPIAPISIRCDSAATSTKAYSQMYKRKSRHLGVMHSKIHELITNEVVSIEFVRSQQNLADHLTKGLARGLVI